MSFGIRLIISEPLKTQLEIGLRAGLSTTSSKADKDCLFNRKGVLERPFFIYK